MSDSSLLPGRIDVSLAAKGSAISCGTTLAGIIAVGGKRFGFSEASDVDAVDQLDNPLRSAHKRFDS